MEAPAGFEPAIRVLQTRALPLGHGAMSSRVTPRRLPRTHSDARVYHAPKSGFGPGSDHRHERHTTVPTSGFVARGAAMAA